MPLEIFPLTGLTMDHVPLSELHIMMGVTNKLVDELIKVRSVQIMKSPLKSFILQVWPEGVLWPKTLHLLREDYHKGFEGNQCRQLLKSVDKLENIVAQDCDNTEKVYENHPAKVFIDTFNALNKVVAGCFGKNLSDDYKQRISNFSDNYDKCNISITSKVHAIKAHLEDFLDKNQTGLALFSEQAFEAIHSKFMKTWDKYKIKDKTNPNFPKALFSAVLDFNGANII